jgi:hypothetical protein
MLARRGDRDEPQRGLVILAESSYRENLERLARSIWSRGHRWGEIHNQADEPYFAPAQRTRLLQLADFVSDAVFGNYESGYGRPFQTIGPESINKMAIYMGLFILPETANLATAQPV